MNVLYLKYARFIPALLLLSLSLTGPTAINGQTIFCPPNLDFELGNLSNWKFYTGNCCPITTTTLSGPVTNRHVLTSGSNTDPYGGFPVVSPGGGSYSLKLGNNGSNSQAERARYYIQVPGTPGDYIFVYRYAVVFQDPGHVPSAQPRFEVRAYDSLTQDSIPCTRFTYVASSSLPGFTQSGVAAGVYYKPWTTATLNLKGYNGRTVAIDFATGDCALGAHFGYGYVDMQCGFFQVTGVYCNGDSLASLTGPPGFEYYTWMDTTFAAVIDTGQTIIVNRAIALKKYAILVTPYAGLGCTDTFFTTRLEDTSALAVSPVDTTVCKGTQVQLKPPVSGSHVPFNYSWSPPTGLTCVTCAQPSVTPIDTVTYKVVISDKKGCKDSATVTINAVPFPTANAGPDTGGCTGDSVILAGSGTGAEHWWYPATDMSGAATLTPTVKISAGTQYYLVMSNAHICNDTDEVNVSLYPQPVATAGNDTVICKGGMMQLSGGGGGAGTTYSWSPPNRVYSPNQQNPVIYADSMRTYKLVVTSSFGCMDSAQVKVDIYPTPTADAGPDTIACRGMQAILSGTGGVTYAWYPSNLVVPPNHATVWATANTARSFYLVVTNEYNCKDTDDVYVDLYPDALADAGPDTGVCPMQEIQLNGSGGVSYLWSPAAGLSAVNIANPKLAVAANKLYVLTVTDANGCTDNDSVWINIHPLPKADAGPDTAVCRGRPFTLSGSGGVYYQWSPAWALSDASLPLPTVHTDSNTRFVLMVTDSNGCRDTDDVFVTINPLPVANAGPDTAVCTGEEVQLNASGGVSYSWSPANNLDDAKSATPRVLVAASTSYTVRVTNSYGCEDDDTITVTAYPNPEAFAGNDTSVCPGATVMLKGRGGAVYRWSPADGLSDSAAANPMATIRNKTVYKLVVRSIYDCIDSAVISIDTIPLQFKVEPVDDICKGEELQLSASGADRYVWRPGHLLDDSLSSAPAVVLNASTVFTVVMTEQQCNRTDSYRVPVIVHSLPGLKAIASDKDCGQEYGWLSASGAQSYHWMPEDGLEAPGEAQTKANPPVTTMYTLIGTDDYGCTDTAAVELKVLAGDGRLFIPNAFTPNGDGINDCYRVFVPGDVTEFRFSIYNRFGERVFYATGRDHCWDGTYEGVPAELSTYFYYYEATSSVCGKVFRKGDMHLLR